MKLVTAREAAAELGLSYSSFCWHVNRGTAGFPRPKIKGVRGGGSQRTVNQWDLGALKSWYVSYKSLPRDKRGHLTKTRIDETAQRFNNPLARRFISGHL